MLMVNELIGFGAASDRPLPILTFTDSALDTSDASTYTFTSRAIGTAAADRVVVVAANTIATAGNTLLSATIGGVSATVVGTASGTASNFAQSALCYAVVPTGTTGTIVLNWSGSGTTFRMYIGVWSITGLVSSVHSANGSATTNAAAIALTIPTAGVCVACGTTLFSSNPTYTWTNLTENYDAAGEATNERYSGAAAVFPTGGSTITATASSSSNSSSIAAAWA